jgi:hypothetical protein
LGFFNKTLEKLTLQGRISENNDGIRILNWEKYQARAREEKALTGFPALLEQLSGSQNKVAFLVDTFRTYHSNAPPEDLTNPGGRIAGMLKAISNDYGYLLKLIWDTSSASIAGSHLNYIQGIIRKRKDAGKLSTDEEIAKSIGEAGKCHGDT